MSPAFQAVPFKVTADLHSRAVAEILSSSGNTRIKVLSKHLGCPAGRSEGGMETKPLPDCVPDALEAQSPAYQPPER